MINRLFSPEVMVQVASSDMWKGTLYLDEEVLIKTANLTRKREFTAGRLCARKGLEQLGVKNFPVLIGENREPLWPPGIIGSIAHCKNFCAAVVVRIGALIGIGLDVEPLEPMTDDVLGLICTPDEKEWLLSASDNNRLLWAKLIFCAKESAFKCYFPLSQTYLDFQDVEVSINPDNKNFSVSLLVPPPSTLTDIRTLNGRYESNEHYVYTGVEMTSRGNLLPV
jgi:4'-phosphopantetheinyl transferase EntD